MMKEYKEVFAQAFEDSGTKSLWKYLIWGYVIVVILDWII